MIRSSPGYRDRVFDLVVRIPKGRVMSYGQVARVLGKGYDARAIGNVMHATPDDGRSIPWHRVINSAGGCSTAGLTLPPDLQQRLLEAEGIIFSERGRCDIKSYLWYPREYEDEAVRGERKGGGSAAKVRGRKQTTKGAAKGSVAAKTRKKETRRR